MEGLLPASFWSPPASLDAFLPLTIDSFHLIYDSCFPALLSLPFFSSSRSQHHGFVINVCWVCCCWVSVGVSCVTWMSSLPLILDLIWVTLPSRWGGAWVSGVSAGLVHLSWMPGDVGSGKRPAVTVGRCLWLAALFVFLSTAPSTTQSTLSSHPQVSTQVSYFTSFPLFLLLQNPFPGRGQSNF